MSHGMDHRPGVAYRRPDGDPDRLVVESSDEGSIPIDEASRSDWLSVVHPEDRSRLREALSDRQVDVAYRLVRDDGETWVHERGRRRDGDVLGYLFRAGERVERERELETQRERLDEFASVVSHDLRNPLSVAVGNLELASELDGDDANDRIDRAQESLDRMDELIGDLLALAREGRTVEEGSETELRTVVDRSWRTVGTDADAELDVADRLPRVSCDRGRLRQVFENLFRNSVEHAPDPVRVEVGTLSDRSGFYVADDGPGVDPSERERVFEPGHTTAQDGTGFGLAIVERIVEAHGWTVELTESADGGARFEFGGIDIQSGAPRESDTGPGVHTDPAE